MLDHIPLHASVALLHDVQTRHINTDAPLTLHRGDIGTVVLVYSNGDCEVEFADRDGRAFAMRPLPTGSLLALRDAPEGDVIAGGIHSA